jgi:hypothetical protein
MASSTWLSSGVNGEARAVLISSWRRILSCAKRSISMRPAWCIARRRCTSVSGGTSIARTRQLHADSNRGSTSCLTTCHPASARRIVTVTVGCASVPVTASTIVSTLHNTAR